MPTFARLNQRNKTSATRDIEIRGWGARSATRIELPINCLAKTKGTTHTISKRGENRESR